MNVVKATVTYHFPHLVWPSCAKFPQGWQSKIAGMLSQALVLLLRSAVFITPRHVAQRSIFPSIFFERTPEPSSAILSANMVCLTAMSLALAGEALHFATWSIKNLYLLNWALFSGSIAKRHNLRSSTDKFALSKTIYVCENGSDMQWYMAMGRIHWRSNSLANLTAPK